MALSVPKTAANRLSLYLRRLRELESQGVKTISSRALADHLGIKGELVRRDLGYFGSFGRRGIGYPIKDLIRNLRNILGTDRKLNVALIGFGNLGRALASYAGFSKRNFQISAIFDSDPRKVGQPIRRIRVRPSGELVSYLKRRRIRLAILAVPADAAQEVAEDLVQGGVTGILNFAPTVLELPKHVAVNNVDLAAGLERLSFELRYLANS